MKNIKIVTLLIILINHTFSFSMDNVQKSSLKNKSINVENLSFPLKNIKFIHIDDKAEATTSFFEQQMPPALQYKIIEQLLLQENTEDRFRKLAALSQVNKRFNHLCSLKTLPKEIEGLLSLKKLTELNLKKAIFIAERVNFESIKDTIELKPLSKRFISYDIYQNIYINPKVQWLSNLSQALYDLHNKTTTRQSINLLLENDEQKATFVVSIDYIDLMGLLLIDLGSLPATNDYENYHLETRTLWEQKESLLLQSKELDAIMSLLPWEIERKAYFQSNFIYQKLISKWGINPNYYRYIPGKLIREQLGIDSEEMKRLHKPIKTAILH